MPLQKTILQPWYTILTLLGTHLVCQPMWGEGKKCTTLHQQRLQLAQFHTEVIVMLKDSGELKPYID